jgi:exonuclease III
MHEQGMSVVSLNVAGVSAFKLFLLLEQVNAHVICLQETWLASGVDCLPVPGYNWCE